VHLVGTAEADAAGTEAQVGVAGAGGISRTGWTGVCGAEFAMGRKGEGELFRIDVIVGAREDRLLGGLPSRDFTHDKRLFLCAGNDVLRLSAPFLLLLLLSDCPEGEVY
jgi:hypothetical protein